MNKLALTSLLLALGCAGGDKDGSADDGTTDDGTTDDGSTDAGGDSAGDDGAVDTSELNGTAPAEALPAPEFTATNMDGSLRTDGDLIGSPTVMWFYPKAATAG